MPCFTKENLVTYLSILRKLPVFKSYSLQYDLPKLSFKKKIIFLFILPDLCYMDHGLKGIGENWYGLS